MNSVYNISIANFKAVIDKKTTIKRLSEQNPPRILLCGFVSNLISNEEFELFDGTDKLNVKMDQPLEGVQIGKLVKVIAISNKSAPFRPVSIQLCQCGEQLLIHCIDCCSVIDAENTKKEEGFAFMDNFANFG